MLKGTARAYTNIALIKYWGKKDDALILPMNNSLSLTLDAFYTDTTVTFSDSFTNDRFILDNTLQDQKATTKITRFLDLVREKMDQPLYAEVISTNHVPTAAGLASSASGLAALALACNEALHLELSKKDLSRLARRGSGSACRSIFGGFVEWQQGKDDLTSFAQPIEADRFEDELAMVFILLNDKQKDVSSRDGMKRTVDTSAFYPNWIKTAGEDLIAIRQALATKSFTRLGEITEANALKMHATTLAAVPPFTYWSPESLRAMDVVRTLRQNGLECYFTMDAGPNVKVLCQKKDRHKLIAQLEQAFSKEQIICALAGPDAHPIEMEVTL
ncbi:diphosphomevalonate decarboxylase [uncultured Enterococcus sp.]|uniref:diphosphomevalonate decarboxylase n=1 Tax=uncultured Enterococcus sp. TaxID=167972 RepID=UPI0025E4CAD2|nr:diphosphomevalonate decarboxylase [uncultured Enterococcus sp.]